jgi:hypothetical protein
MPDPQTMMAMQLLQQILMGAGSGLDPEAVEQGEAEFAMHNGNMANPPFATENPGIGTQGMPSDVPPGATMPPTAMPAGQKRPPVHMPQGKQPQAHKPKVCKDQKSYKALGKSPKPAKPKANEPRK